MDTIKKKKKLLIVIGLVLIVFVWLFRTFIAPPKDFPAPYTLTIEPGQTLFSISNELRADSVIRSQRLFEIFMISLGSDKAISEGEYSFPRPLSSLEIALRISGKYFGVEKQKVTFPEGFTIKEMSARLAVLFPEKSSEEFLALTKGKEGYLFPDTYNFFPNVSTQTIVKTLETTFERKVAPLASDIKASGRSLSQVVVMASIIEKEASGTDDRAIVSGILWKRFDSGFPLQVDAPFLYVLGKESKELTRADLALNSPYNTYTHTGLPPTPINNPGLAAIRAAIHPKASPYMYYLHDAQRNIHYAATYTEHQANIKKYLQ